MTLAVAETLSPYQTKPNLDMTLAVAETLSPYQTKPILDMTMAVANKPKHSRLY